MAQRMTAPTDLAPWARPIPRESLSESAYRAMREALAEGRLRPGEPLPLRPLSQRFEISVTPMREALLRLATEHLLVMDARGAASVPQLTVSQIDEILTLRGDLEGRAAVQAARIASEAEIDGLAEINLAIIEARDSGRTRDAVRANTLFHLEICRLARAPILTEIVEGLWVRSGPLLWHSEDQIHPPWSARPHLVLIEALRARDAEAAREAMLRDVARWSRGYRQYAVPDPDPEPAPGDAPENGAPSGA